MNDSFLNDLDELIPKEQKSQKSRPPFNQHITTRGNYFNSSTPQSSSKSHTDLYPKVVVLTGPIEKHKADKTSTPNTTEKQNSAKQSQKSERKLSDCKQKAPKSKSATIKVEDIKPRFKVLNNKSNIKEQNRVDKFSKESSASSDASTKENNYPLDTPVTSRCRREVSKSSDGPIKRPILSEAADVTALLNMIKDLISTYTKAESTKIMRCLAELHVDSKANLLQQLFLQTDDILEELQPCKDPNKLKALVSENERLKEDIMILQMRNDELRKRVQDALAIKEENIILKMKLKELEK